MDDETPPDSARHPGGPALSAFASGRDVGGAGNAGTVAEGGGGVRAGLVIRETTAELHNRIANHPEVKPTLGYNEGPTDFTPLLDHPEAYVLLSDGGGVGMVFEWSAPRTWQAHFMILPESRGRQAVEAGREMAEWMFRETGARMLWGMAPKDSQKVATYGRLIGAKPDGGGQDAAGREVQFFTVERS